MTWNEEIKAMREAANKVFCSVNTLKSYESGERIPRDEMAGRIYKLYKGVVDVGK